MKELNLPRNKIITVRVTPTQKYNYTKSAKTYNLSVSEWASLILEEHKNNFQRKDNTNQITEVIENIMDSLEDILKKIEYRKNNVFKFSNEQIELHILNTKIFLSQHKLRSLKKRVIDLKTDDD